MVKAAADVDWLLAALSLGGSAGGSWLCLSRAVLFTRTISPFHHHCWNYCVVLVESCSRHSLSVSSPRYYKDAHLLDPSKTTGHQSSVILDRLTLGSPTLSYYHATFDSRLNTISTTLTIYPHLISCHNVYSRHHCARELRWSGHLSWYVARILCA